MCRRNLRRVAAAEREQAESFDQAEPVDTEAMGQEGPRRDAQGRFLPKDG
ncbi:hypothetical protein [Asticcacaulis sp.]|nr:hypothetical protein [Asticcacaulis sp.]